MELNKKNEEILNSAEYDEFGKGLFDFITKDETSENKEETLVGQIGTGDKMSQDKLGQDKMSQDKLGQETKCPRRICRIPKMSQDKLGQETKCPRS